MTLIEIRPHRWGWKAFEAPGVEPVFLEKDQAIDYAENRACFRSGEIRILEFPMIPLPLGELEGRKRIRRNNSVKYYGKIPSVSR
jgi:hypothetical protein